jgi:penicillin-binding protein 1B
VKGPSLYQPRSNPKQARQRRDVVLRLLFEHAEITEQEYQQAVAAELDITPRPAYSTTAYPAFVDLVKRQLQQDYNENDLQTEGLRIFTSFDPIMQRNAETATVEKLKQFDEHYHQDLQVSMVVTTVGNAEVLALVSDKDPRFAGYNRAINALRPIGSLVKPVVYMTALQHPDHFHWGTLISDEPLTVDLPNKTKWQPRNYDKTSHGDVHLIDALANSYNQATARVGLAVGAKAVAANLTKLGFERDVMAVPSLFLGAVDMSPWEVATLYHTLASGGFYTHPRAIHEVVDSAGKPLKRYHLELEKRISSEDAYLTQFGMQWSPTAPRDTPTRASRLHCI